MIIYFASGITVAKMETFHACAKIIKLNHFLLLKKQPVLYYQYIPSVAEIHRRCIRTSSGP